MDIHKQVAAWLAIAKGILCLLLTLVSFFLFGGLAVIAGDARATGLFAILWGLIFLLFGVFGILDIVAGIFYLRGSSVARVWLIISNILALFGFPVGTLIGAYSLWAILKQEPVKEPTPVIYESQS